jgi:ubiquinone/menaquinone biosynthesis C-methylase UbiE
MMKQLTSAVAGAALALACASPAPPPAAPSTEPAPPNPHHGGHSHHPSHSCGSANHRFEDADRWAKVFDDPERDAWQHPDDVVRELGLSPSGVVADLGAGTGYFSVRLARAVPQGKVYAVDVEPGMVKHVEERARRAKLGNVTGIVAAADDPKLPSGIDVVLVVDTYHHISERTRYFTAVLPKLAPSGRVVIVDFKKGDFPVGPPDAHKISPDSVKSEMEAAGYQQCRSYDALPYQYVLFFAQTC